MEYPFFEVPRLGGGMVIAMIAIFHVFIAHFAVGGGLFLAIGETVARRRNDRVLLRFLRDEISVLVLISFVAGAVSGVGIWVSIGLTSPAATSALIHNFVWGWATEWVFFIVEIAAGYVYYYTWDTMPPRKHVIVGWIYAVAAFLSLVIINGILSFMLTTGEWPSRLAAGTLSGDAAFWTGFFNPTYWPSTLLRTVSCLALAGIAAAVIVNARRHYTREERHHVINFASYFLVPLGLMVPLAVWYLVQVPSPVRELPLGGAIAMTLFLIFGLVASVLIGFYAYFGLIRRHLYINLETSALLLAAAFLATGSMEFVREGIRKPFLIYGYMYSNGILATPQEAEKLNRDGILAHAPFASPPPTATAVPATLAAAERPTLTPAEQRLRTGESVYKAQCRICHEPGGTNAVEAIVPNATRAWMERTVRQLHQVRYFMPPFYGTEDELQALVDYQMSLLRPQTTAVPKAAAPTDATHRAEEGRLP